MYKKIMMLMVAGLTMANSGIAQNKKETAVA